MKDKVVAYIYKGKAVDFQEIKKKNLNIKELKSIKITDIIGKNIFRHSGAHLLAHVLESFYPGINFATGPHTNCGFFYDFQLPNNKQFSAKDFPKIKSKMLEIIKKDLPIERKVLSKEKIQKLFAKDELKGQIIRELIDDGEENFTIYEQGSFLDLCRGPHVPSTGYIPGFFALESLSEINWRNKRIQRLKVYHFESQEALDEYLLKIKQALRHKEQGKKMELFHMIKEAPGFALWDRYGIQLRRKLCKLILEETAKGFHEVETPPMMDKKLWKKTGHLDKYGDGMYHYDHFCLKPMNCPAHSLFAKSLNLSYKQLPYRIFEFGRCFRNEPPGGLNGMKRLRNFMQDDGHIFCQIEHIKNELKIFMERAKKLYEILGFSKILIKFSTRPDKYIGTIEKWDKAENLLMESLNSLGYIYEIAKGEGAFYGPKIELHIKDSLGKLWQCGTLQVDFFLAENLKVTFDNKEGKKEHPIVLHRATLGSIERFLAIMLENNEKIPQVINPFPLVILPIKTMDLSPLTTLLDESKIKYIIDDQGRIGPRKYKYNKTNNGIIIIGPREITSKTFKLMKNNEEKEFSFDEIKKAFC